jgi:hypothetical protein
MFVGSGGGGEDKRKREGGEREIKMKGKEDADSGLVEE